MVVQLQKNIMWVTRSNGIVWGTIKTEKSIPIMSRAFDNFCHKTSSMWYNKFLNSIAKYFFK